MPQILPNTLEIIEVSPRDGIQNEKSILDLDTKLELITKAATAGARRVEVTSFVNGKRVPQMADADDLVRALPKGLVRSIGLALNHQGFARAIDGGVNEINFVIVASETFSLRNQGTSVDQTLSTWTQIAAETPAGIGRSATIGAAFGCPFEGEMPLEQLIKVAGVVMASNPDELALADTIGVATPIDIAMRVAAIRERWPDVPLRLHLHNTRNTGIANAWAAITSGVNRIDASLGGSGGCPFAPRATGNIATEDLLYLAHRSGIETGWDLESAIQAAQWLETKLGHELPGMVMKAGGFAA